MRILLVFAAAACVYARTADQQQSLIPGPITLSTDEVPDHRLKRAISDEFLYELNGKGERVMVKSIESTRSAKLRFTNLTNRPVDIWWRNFEGRRVHYKQVAAKESYDVDTFITHPWEFTDAQTKESYAIELNVPRTIFNSPSYAGKLETIFRAPNAVGGRNDRTNFNIVPLY